MKSEAEVADEDEAEADLSMRRPSGTINYAKYLLRCVCVCVCVLRVYEFSQIRFWVCRLDYVPLQPFPPSQHRDWLDIDTAPCGDAFSFNLSSGQTHSRMRT